MTYSTWTIAVAAVSLAVLPANAADPTFAGSADVVAVEVPVQVIKEGEPVRGLTRDDFELFDGRRKVVVDGFEVLDLSTAPAAAAAAPTLPVSARRHFLLLFDLTFSDPNALLRGREAARKVLDDLHPTDLVAVATYSASSGPQLALGFTPDRAQAAAAIETLGMSQLFTRASDPLRLVMTDPGQAVPSRSGGASAAAAAREEREAEVADALKSVTALSSRAEKSVDQLIVRNMTASFADLARAISSIDGRKYVVLLSQGFDSSLVSGSGPAEAGHNDMTNLLDAVASPDQISGSDGGTGSDTSFGDTRTQNALEKMLEEFRRADCQIEAVDVGGLRALANEGRQTANGRESLLTMAKSTGGELYENYNDLAAAMQQMLHRTGVTYVLSFQPKDLALDGSFHKLRVELKNAPRGARVVHRPGYYAPRPYQEQPPLQRLLETANAVMGEEGGGIATAVLAAPFAASGERAYVPVLIEVTGASLLAGKSAGPLPVEVYVYAIDEHGSVQGFLSQSMGLDLARSEPKLREAGLKFFGHLDLPPGSYSLRTLVRNGASGAFGLRVTALEVPAFGSGSTLLPAFFPETPGRWMMVRENQPAGQAAVPYPFMVGGQPYIPSSLPVLTPGQPAALVLQGYNLGTGAIKAEARVVSAEGKEVPGGDLTLGSHEGGGAGALRIKATFQPPLLAPGEYVLRTTMTDGAGQARTSTTRFAVAAASGGR